MSAWGWCVVYALRGCCCCCCCLLTLCAASKEIATCQKRFFLAPKLQDLLRPCIHPLPPFHRFWAQCFGGLSSSDMRTRAELLITSARNDKVGTHAHTQTLTHSLSLSLSFFLSLLLSHSLALFVSPPSAFTFKALRPRELKLLESLIQDTAPRILTG